MTAGNLIAAYAYEVAPQQEAPFAGGSIPVSDALQNALNHTFDRSRIGNAPKVTFQVRSDSANRAHPIRDEALVVAFDDDKGGESALRLAIRLAGAMDNRSKPTLLVVSVHASPREGSRRVLLWTFPQEEVFNLNTSSDEAALEMLDAFNRESKLRKAALIEGPNEATSMLNARVLDFQSTAAERAVADLWIVKFLHARLQMSDAEGTQLLARVLRATHTKTRADQAAQDQIGAAIGALRLIGDRRVSLDSIERAYLSGSAAATFSGASRPEERAAMFSIDHTKFDDMIQYRRFALNNGVVVSAPFLEVGEGKGVMVDEIDGDRILRAEGTILEEQVRTRAS